jgi:hypothetical protein
MNQSCLVEEENEEKTHLSEEMLLALKDLVLSFLESQELKTCNLEIDASLSRKNVIIRSHKIYKDGDKIVKVTEFL